MSRAKQIKHIVIHCSAGNGLIPAIEKFWYSPKSKGGLGWKNPGYHVIIYVDGQTWYVTKDGTYSTDKSKWYPELICNGVLGWNKECLHINYIGGVEKKIKNGKETWIAKDTRTDEQKGAIIEAITECMKWLKDNGNTLTDLKILGHRDFSDDKNGNGVIESWERIKECPSFDAIPEYGWIAYTNENNKAFDLPIKK